eukprot:scaffold283_cov316-Pavlova_lutheri.AAC.35
MSSANGPCALVFARDSCCSHDGFGGVPPTPLAEEPPHPSPPDILHGNRTASARFRGDDLAGSASGITVDRGGSGGGGGLIRRRPTWPRGNPHQDPPHRVTRRESRPGATEKPCMRWNHNGQPNRIGRGALPRDPTDKRRVRCAFESTPSSPGMPPNCTRSRTTRPTWTDRRRRGQRTFVTQSPTGRRTGMGEQAKQSFLQRGPRSQPRTSPATAAWQTQKCKRHGYRARFHTPTGSASARANRVSQTSIRGNHGGQGKAPARGGTKSGGLPGCLQFRSPMFGSTRLYELAVERKLLIHHQNQEAFLCFSTCRKRVLITGSFFRASFGVLR